MSEENVAREENFLRVVPSKEERKGGGGGGGEKNGGNKQRNTIGTFLI